jgi:hypothetical protein
MTPSFAVDVRPMFRPTDLNCMGNVGVFLGDYDYMSDPAGNADHPDYANARAVLDRLSGAMTPRMPPGGPYWGEVQISVLKAWIDAGCPA